MIHLRVYILVGGIAVTFFLNSFDSHISAFIVWNLIKNTCHIQLTSLI